MQISAKKPHTEPQGQGDESISAPRSEKNHHDRASLVGSRALYVLKSPSEESTESMLGAGLAAFSNGCTARMLQIAPGAAISWLLYESVKLKLQAVA